MECLGKEVKRGKDIGRMLGNECLPERRFNFFTGFAYPNAISAGGSMDPIHAIPVKTTYI